MKKILIALAFSAAPFCFAETKPNDGRAESLLGNTGAVLGGGAGAAAGAALSGNPAVSGATGVAGSLAGERIGRAAGSALDNRAVENAKSGRGGKDDPRFDPRTIFPD